MDRKFLETLGLEKETIDKVLDEASKDIGKQKAAIDAKTEELKTATQRSTGFKADSQMRMTLFKVEIVPTFGVYWKRKG